MLKAIKHYWWLLFFSAYWTAVQWGEKRNPRNTAIYHFTFLILLNLSGILQIGLLYNIKLSGLQFTVFCALPAFIIPYLAFKKGRTYHERFLEFYYLNNPTYRKSRMIRVIGSLTLSIAFNSGIAILRNVTHSL
ncbi:hypothetical protein HQ865_20780 [Mucilaginibacter mali]|uniref:Uncharacterized protein n=1 Tax=Mucilaginibacter mali TaxID=2740462 RepID=A0A7D4TX65_9SPHI|nr:hypothetical protein [Mucilaginibacter mali]QKJ32095.1 hypothetical protein HQ865_20780 [Mucilaginibacter mali]